MSKSVVLFVALSGLVLRHRMQMLQSTNGTPLSNLLIAFVLSGTLAAGAESLTVRQMMERAKEWPVWVRDQTTLHISGRYEGRAARQFQLRKLDVRMTPNRTTVLPGDIQADQRLTVTGKLRMSGGQCFLDATRIAAGSLDTNRLQERAQAVPKDAPTELYQLADEFEEIAEFYNDKVLDQQCQDLRITAFQKQRTLAKSDATKLLQLSESGKAAGISDQVLSAVRFESLYVRWKQSANDEQLIKSIREWLPGWDRRNAFRTAQEEQDFLKAPVARYEAAEGVERERMHRRFYRMVRGRQILQELKNDGSNGKDLAMTFTAELPEEEDQIATLNASYVEYRLQRVPTLTRKQLEDVQQLLQDAGRNDEFPDTLTQWLQAQEKRLNNRQLDGMLLMADEYLFAFERWKNPDHAKAGAELLKTAWFRTQKDAPREAVAIEQRLQKLGWTRLHDRWMTAEEVDQLPRNDAELAMREGRVVEGMTAEQVVAIQGQPARRTRLISARSIQEIWVFGDETSATVKVHLERSRFQTPDEAVVLRVVTGGN